MKIPTALFSFAIAIASCSLASAQTQLTLKDLKGTQSCGGTVYDWPDAKHPDPSRVGSASVEVVGDGNGNWTSGNATAPGAGSKNSCALSLVKGTYKINRSGFESDITWKITSGDAHECAKFVSYFSGVMHPESDLTSRVMVYADSIGVGYQFGHGPAGFGVGACKLGPH